MLKQRTVVPEPLSVNASRIAMPSSLDTTSATVNRERAVTLPSSTVVDTNLKVRERLSQNMARHIDEPKQDRSVRHVAEEQRH